jgi:hypothetical protein
MKAHVEKGSYIPPYLLKLLKVKPGKEDAVDDPEDEQTDVHDREVWARDYTHLYTTAPLGYVFPPKAGKQGNTSTQGGKTSEPRQETSPPRTQAAGEKAAGKKALGKKAAGEKAAGTKPPGAKSAAEKSPPSQPPSPHTMPGAAATSKQATILSVPPHPQQQQGTHPELQQSHQSRPIQPAMFLQRPQPAHNNTRQPYVQPYHPTHQQVVNSQHRQKVQQQLNALIPNGVYNPANFIPQIVNPPPRYINPTQKTMNEMPAQERLISPLPGLNYQDTHYDIRQIGNNFQAV